MVKKDELTEIKLDKSDFALIVKEDGKQRLYLPKKGYYSWKMFYNLSKTCLQLLEVNLEVTKKYFCKSNKKKGR